MLESAELPPEKRKRLEELKSRAQKEIFALWDGENNYFHSTDKKSTIFICSLAGEWFVVYFYFTPTMLFSIFLKHMYQVCSLCRISNHNPFPPNPKSSETSSQFICQEQ